MHDDLHVRDVRSASSGIRRRDQIPASTSSQRSREHQETVLRAPIYQREITLHPPVAFTLSCLLAERHARSFSPRSRPATFPASSWPSPHRRHFLFRERNLHAHCKPCHRRHGGHGKGDGDLRTRDWSFVRVSEFTRKVLTPCGRIRFGCEFCLACEALIAPRACAGVENKLRVPPATGSPSRSGSWRT